MPLAHPDALRHLASLAPAGSDPHRFALGAARGVVLQAGGADQAQATRLLAPKGATGPVVCVREDLWRMVDDVRVQGTILLDVLARHLADPGREGRDALADALLEEPDPLRRWAWPVPSQGDEVARALDAWQLVDDPLRVRMAQLLAALDADPVAVTDGPTFRASWRRHLEWRRRPARDLGEVASAGVQRALLREGEAFEVDGLLVPAFSAPAATVEDPVAAVLEAVGSGARVLGVCGAAAAGKSTLVRQLAGALAGRTVARVDGDAFTWMGDGFRYTQHETSRTEWIEGSGVYDDRAMARAIVDVRERADVVIVDGVFLGLEPALRDLWDIRLLVVREAVARLSDKLARDRAADATRTIDVVDDFVRKQFREVRDAGPRLSSGSLVWRR